MVGLIGCPGGQDDLRTPVRPTPGLGAPHPRRPTSDVLAAGPSGLLAGTPDGLGTSGAPTAHGVKVAALDAALAAGFSVWMADTHLTREVFEPSFRSLSGMASRSSGRCSTCPGKCSSPATRSAAGLTRRIGSQRPSCGWPTMPSTRQTLGGVRSLTLKSSSSSLKTCQPCELQSGHHAVAKVSPLTSALGYCRARPSGDQRRIAAIVQRNMCLLSGSGQPRKSDRVGSDAGRPLSYESARSGQSASATSSRTIDIQWRLCSHQPERRDCGSLHAPRPAGSQAGCTASWALASR